MRPVLVSLCMLLGACDMTAQDTLEPATEIDIRAGAAAVPGSPVRVDPCGEFPVDPGFVLRSDEVLVPDLCLAKIPNFDGCFVRLADDVIDVPELKIWCDFDCNGEGLEIGIVHADFPDEGVAHYSIATPCPEGAVE